MRELLALLLSFVLCVAIFFAFDKGLLFWHECSGFRDVVHLLWTGDKCKVVPHQSPDEE